MFSIANSALKDNKVVKLPGPAIKGKARGKTVAVIAAEPLLSSLYKVIPKIISKAIKNNINEPATAKEFTSIPIKFSKLLPTKRNKIIIKPAIKEAFSDCICPTFLRKSIIIGMLPIISITANNTIKAVIISLKLKFILVDYFFAKLVN